MESPDRRTLAAANRLSTVEVHGSPGFLAGVCAVASLGGLLFGFDTAVISGTVDFVEKQFALSKVEVGWFGSSALVGCIAGAALAGWFGDRYGRRPVLIVAAALFFVSALLSTVPESFSILIPARIIGGLGVGVASVLAPMYISEFSPPRLRGRLVALYQLSIVIGILAAYFSNYLLLGFAEGNPGAFGGRGLLHWVLVAEVWRGMFGAEMIPAGLFFALLFLVPESPRWLIDRGENQRALGILSRIDGRETAQRELAEISTSVAHEEGTLGELLRPGLRKALLVGVGLSFFGQLTGVNIVVYYGPSIMREAGLAIGSALEYQVALGIINLVFTVVAIWKIDSWGRRPLLIGGMALVALTMGVTALLMLVNAPALWVVALLCAYMACVAVSICAVIWVLTPEIFPNRVRGRGASISTFTNWTTNAFSAFVFPWYVAALGMHAGFFTFAAICCVATVFFWKLVPETKGRSLEQIEELWLAGGGRASLPGSQHRGTGA
jgi:SP family arabinose:H+ symporter-like MFS transporter